MQPAIGFISAALEPKLVEETPPGIPRPGRSGAVREELTVSAVDASSQHLGPIVARKSWCFDRDVGSHINAGSPVQN